MGICFSCFKTKVNPIVYKKNYFIMYNPELVGKHWFPKINKVDSETNEKKTSAWRGEVIKDNVKTKYLITTENNNMSIRRKIQSCDNMSLLADSISPLSRHSSRKAKSMDCLFSVI